MKLGVPLPSIPSRIAVGSEHGIFWEEHNDTKLRHVSWFRCQAIKYYRFEVCTHTHTHIDLCGLRLPQDTL